ncbi:MAG: hypothetical protein IT223_11165 [Crocinitomicaceae bacterium]|nr:hypothetical protein [Crocinitomicaceae bacterium]
MNKNYLLFSVSTFFISFLLSANIAFGQCKPSIRIDGNISIVDQTSPAGLQFPIWLKTGQTLAIDQSTFSISVIEFIVDGNALAFSQVLTVTTVQTVPADRVWKVESVVKQLNPSSYSSITYSNYGTYSWKVPACASYICIEAWGGGGGGGGNATQSGSYAGAGGGGAYGQECFNVTPGTTYTVTVGAGGTGGSSSGGAGGSGGSSSVGSLITAGGGYGGTGNAGGAGGAGGTSTAANNISGGDGTNGNSPCNTAGLFSRGGIGGNGGAGGLNLSPCNGGVAGTAPGGAGSSGGWYNVLGAAGAAGKVVITW